MDPERLARLDAMIAAYRAAPTMRDMCSELGMSSRAIRKYMKGATLHGKRGRPSLSADVLARVQAAISAGAPFSAVERDVHVSTMAIRRYRKEGLFTLPELCRCGKPYGHTGNCVGCRVTRGDRQKVEVSVAARAMFETVNVSALKLPPARVVRGVMSSHDKE